MTKPNQERLNYVDLVRQVAFRTYLPPETIRLVLDGVLAVMGEALQNKLQVRLSQFATIYPHVRRSKVGPLGFAVSLTIKPAQALRQSLRKALLP